MKNKLLQTTLTKTLEKINEFFNITKSNKSKKTLFSQKGIQMLAKQ